MVAEVGKFPDPQVMEASGRRPRRAEARVTAKGQQAQDTGRADILAQV